MWDLIESLPIGPEDACPPGRTRVMCFPQLKHLHADDATWLAETFLRLAESEWNLNRSLTLVVMPEEEEEQAPPANGSRALAEAFKKRLRVATQPVKREDIDRWSQADATTPPEYLLQAVQEHIGYEVVVVDESAVSLGTLHQLQAMIRSANGGRSPALTATVVEARTSGSNIVANFRSLYQWSPVTNT